MALGYTGVQPGILSACRAHHRRRATGMDNAAAFRLRLATKKTSRLCTRGSRHPFVDFSR
jgi:hypothetical protein